MPLLDRDYSTITYTAYDLLWRIASARQTLRDLEKREWNEADHPRGKTTPESTPGSFAPKDGAGARRSEALDQPVAFISPNVGNLDFEQATREVNSQRQNALLNAAEEIEEALGIRAGDGISVVGAWADGAENSTMHFLPDASVEQARAAAAMLGSLADQKSVLVFDPDPDGDAVMASFKASGTLRDIHTTLVDKGVAFHTLQPSGDGAIVHVYASDQETIDAISEAANGYQAEVGFTRGRGEFIGTQQDSGSDRSQRDDALRVYDEVIEGIARSGQLEGRDLAALWQQTRSRWRRSFAREVEKARVRIAKLRAELAELRKKTWNEEDHPRGKTTAASTPGSFAPKEGGEASSEPTKQNPERIGSSDVYRDGDTWRVRPEGTPAETAYRQPTYEAARQFAEMYSNFNADLAAERQSFAERAEAAQAPTPPETSPERIGSNDVFLHSDGSYRVRTSDGTEHSFRSMEQAREYATDLTTTRDEEPEEKTWDNLSSEDQERTEEAYIEHNFRSEYEYQVESWRESDDPLESARDHVLGDSDFNDTLKETIEEVRTEFLEAGESFPYTAEQIARSVRINPGEVRFEPLDLQEPASELFAATAAGQMTFPGIEPVVPADALSEEARTTLSRRIGEVFDEQVRDAVADLDPPDYLEEMARESLIENFRSMDAAESLDVYRRLVADLPAPRETRRVNTYTPSRVDRERELTPEQQQKIMEFERKGINIQPESQARALEIVERWERDIKLAPDEFKTGFLGAEIGKGATMSVDLSPDGALAFGGKIKDEDGVTIGTYSRYIDLANKSATSAYFSIDKEHQGKGIGKQVLANNVAMYQKLGIEKVHVSANIDVGGYAWARYGYVPVAGLRGIWDDVARRIDGLRASDEERATLKALARAGMRSPKNMWAIADSKHGEELLLNLSWAGVMDLKDEETMTRFNAYVNKKRKPDA